MPVAFFRSYISRDLLPSLPFSSPLRALSGNIRTLRLPYIMSRTLLCDQVLTDAVWHDGGTHCPSILA